MNDLNENDPELKAMGEMLAVLQSLEPSARLRVLQWVCAKLQINSSSGAPQVRREGTVSAVAIKMGADSCRTILLAAAVHLSLYQGKDSFTRAEWIACARDARPWKADYNAQIPTIIGRLLTAGLIFEKSRDVFSADAAFLAEQEQKLVG